MLRRMDSRELTGWIAYDSRHPIGGDTQYLGSAIVAATVANANRGKKGKAAKVEDFMPKFRQHEQTVDEQIAFAAALTAAMGGIVAIGGDNGG